MQAQPGEYNESVDSSNVFDRVEEHLKSIKENKAKSTRDGYVTKQLQDAALSLDQCYSFIQKKKPPSEKSDMIKRLTELSKEYQVVEIFCQKCAEILESGERSVYPGIKSDLIDSVEAMLLYLINSSDDNDELSGIISRETGFLTIMTQKLKEWNPIFGQIEIKLDEGGNILELLCTVLHNISMFEENVLNVRNVNCIEAMQPYLKSKDNTVRLLCLATLADLVKESECGILKSTSDIITFLMSIISKAIEVRRYEGWSRTELARIVQQMARNDNNKRMIVQHGAVSLLLKIIDIGNIEEQRAAVYAIWALSFNQENRTEMIQNEEWKVIATLERLSESSDEIVKMTTMKALWTISDHKSSCDKQDDKVTRSVERHILISYNCGNQEKVKKISDGLKKNCFRVWMDVDNIQGSTVDAMSEAVDQADIVLVCYSYKYKNSDNCRVEAEYAWQQGKKIILLKMDSEYEADGWLEPMISSNLHYDLSGKCHGEKKVNEVIGAIQKELNRKNGVAVDVAKPNIEFDNKVIIAQQPPCQNSDKTSESHNDSKNGVAEYVAKPIIESDNKVIIAQQPPRQKIDKIAEIPVLWILLGLFFILFLLLCLLINVACFHSSNNVCPYKECESNSQTVVPGTSGEKPMENQTNAIPSAMNWTLSQVEEWLNAKILRKDMFLSTQKQLKTLRGKDIAFLKLLVHECPTTFYQTIREQLGMKDIQSMSDFRFAFEHIDTTVIDTDSHSTTQQFTSTSTKTVETTKVRLTV